MAREQVVDRALYFLAPDLKIVEPRSDRCWIVEDLNFPNSVEDHPRTHEQQDHSREPVDQWEDLTELPNHTALAESQSQREHRGEQSHAESVADKGTEALEEGFDTTDAAAQS